MEKDWLDNTTKNRCVDKVNCALIYCTFYSSIPMYPLQVNAITRQVAYPDFVKDYSALDKFYEDVSLNMLTNIIVLYYHR